MYPPFLIILPLASLGSLLIFNATGVNRVTSPTTFLICGLASIVAVFFFSSSEEICGGFIILGWALITLGFCGAWVPGGTILRGGMPGGAPGGRSILGGGTP